MQLERLTDEETMVTETETSTNKKEEKGMKTRIGDISAGTKAFVAIVLMLLIVSFTIMAVNSMKNKSSQVVKDADAKAQAIEAEDIFN